MAVPSLPTVPTIRHRGHSVTTGSQPAASPVPGFARSKTITVDHTQLAGTLTNFVATVDLTSDTDIASKARADLADLRFVDMSNNALTFTVEKADNSQFVADGGWCWFNEPRAIRYRSTKNKVYASFMQQDGSVGVASYELGTGTIDTFVLHAALEIDDHDPPGLIVMPSGKIRAYYSQHSVNGGSIFWRETTNVEDVTAWGSEQTISFTNVAGTAGVSYPKPTRMANGTMYIFFRGADYSQCYITSADSGATWSNAVTLFSNSTQRPYVNFYTDESTRVDFIMTDAHPREYLPSLTNLYHCYLEGGSVYKTDGTLISTLAGLDADGIQPSQATKIYDSATDGKAWGWDIARDSGGKPVVVYATMPTDADHHYRYARWTGSAWDDHLLRAAGGTIAPIATGGQVEDQYSAGVAVNKEDPSIVFFGTHPSAGLETEMWRWQTSDGGTTWTKRQLSPGSTTRQIRPVCPIPRGGDTSGGPEVIWEEGGYNSFRDWSTRLVMYPAGVGATVPIAARVKLPSVDNVTDVQFKMFYGNASATSGAGTPFDANVRVRHPIPGRSFPGSAASSYYGFQGVDGFDMSGWTAFTFMCRATLVNGGTNTDYLFSNWSFTSPTTKAGFMARVSAGVLSAFTIKQTDTQIGGAFTTPAGLHDGAEHHVAVTFDTTNGLRAYIDGVLSGVTFTSAGAAIDATASATKTLIGDSPHRVDNPARTAKSTQGTIRDVTISDTARSAAWIAAESKRSTILSLGSETVYTP